MLHGGLLALPAFPRLEPSAHLTSACGKKGTFSARRSAAMFRMHWVPPNELFRMRLPPPLRMVNSDVYHTHPYSRVAPRASLMQRCRPSIGTTQSYSSMMVCDGGLPPHGSHPLFQRFPSFASAASSNHSAPG